MRADDHHAFTLIEILVAIAILGILMTIVYRSFAGTAMVVQEISVKADVHHTVRVIFARLLEELAATDWPQDRMTAVFVGLEGNHTDRRGDFLRFRSRAHVRKFEDARESEFHVVSYAVEGRVLIRREEHNPLSVSGTTVQTDELRGVAELNFRYWDGANWRDGWDAARVGRLPSAVLIELTLEHPHGEPGIFVTTVALPLGAVVPAGGVR
jgi:general secretion pathway protein J